MMVDLSAGLIRKLTRADVTRRDFDERF
jgi:hypothetical protein